MAYRSAAVYEKRQSRGATAHPALLRRLAAAPHVVGVLLLCAWAGWMWAGRVVRRLNVDCHVGTALAGTAPPCPEWLQRHYPPLAAAEVEAALALRRADHDAGGTRVGSGAGDARRPFCDIVLAVPSPSGWAERRQDLRRQFRRSQRLLPRGSCAVLFFVVGTRAFAGGDGRPPAPPPDAAEGDVLLADCTDQDGPDGTWYPTRDSSTTCKVVAALVHAVATHRFHYFARVGDDAFFRFDAFLTRVAPHHLAAGEELAMGSWLLENEHGVPERTAALGGPPGFRASHSLPYLGGMGYVMSYNVTSALAAVALTPGVGLVDAAAEDVMTGLWIAALGRDRLRRVHSPCFHNSAEWAADPTSPAGRSQHNLPAACTPSSLLVHYMNYPTRLWDRIGEDGTLRDCGDAEAESFCHWPPFSWLNNGKPWPGGPVRPEFV